MAELERLTDINLWKINRIDVLICHKLFNIIDEIFERANMIIEKNLSSGDREDVEMIIDTSGEKKMSELDT
jgi:hypothetical protein